MVKLSPLYELWSLLKKIKTLVSPILDAPRPIRREKGGGVNGKAGGKARGEEKASGRGRAALDNCDCTGVKSQRSHLQGDRVENIFSIQLKLVSTVYVLLGLSFYLAWMAIWNQFFFRSPPFEQQDSWELSDLLSGNLLFDGAEMYGKYERSTMQFSSCWAKTQRDTNARRIMGQATSPRASAGLQRRGRLSGKRSSCGNRAWLRWWNDMQR